MKTDKHLKARITEAHGSILKEFAITRPSEKTKGYLRKSAKKLSVLLEAEIAKQEKRNAKGQDKPAKKSKKD